MAAGPANNMDIKRRNRSNTLRCILACGRISQMELSQRLAVGLDLDQLSRIIPYPCTYLNNANAAGLAPR